MKPRPVGPVCTEGMIEATMQGELHEFGPAPLVEGDYEILAVLEESLIYRHASQDVLYQLSWPGALPIEADEEDPGIGHLDAEQLQRAAGVIAHVDDAADGEHECADRRQERPRARIDDVVVVILLMRIRHVSHPRMSPLSPPAVPPKTHIS